MDLVLLAVVAAAFGYGALIAGWRVLLRRWRLSGPEAPQREALGRAEQVARRSLRALLAFDALVVVPAALAALALSLQWPADELSPMPFFLVLAGLGLFVGPVRPMLMRVRTLEAYRLRGLPEPVLVRQVATGHASLDEVLRRPARASQVAAGIIVASSLLCFLFPELGLLLEKNNDAIRAGEVWRLVTVALVHGGLVHLFFNMSVFLDVAGIVERLCGARRMLAIFVFGTAAGTLASVAAMPYPSVGASGGVFALLGALWAVAFRHRHELPPMARSRFLRSTATVIGLNIVIGFSIPHIDWAAHLGGLVGGVLTGLLFGLGPAARAALAGSPAPGAGPWLR